MKVIFGCYFFLSEDRQEYVIQVCRFKQIIAVVGALIHLTFAVVGLGMRRLNQFQLEEFLIHQSYYDIEDKKSKHST